ncbi:MAG: 50S ribosomal protein L17 [Proteobacteria bacterium]|nr:MAG: 50S ribosomal protein L17 [Pseudomonadota bacterium]
MRHKHGYRKLGVDSAHRKAMLRNLATSLITHERITTTVPRAKELRKVVERMITLGKKGELSHRRAAGGYLFEKDAVAKVFGDLATRFKDRKGGYTRIVKRGVRAGDNAALALIEFVDYELGQNKEAPKA